ncbi:unnamed protein product, partial [Heterosigma akashiwo]
MSSGGLAFWLFVVATSMKLLLFPTYKSTDFEVHRNWLAITYSLPLKDWYFEDTSQWTLDYPPFFAYFEWVLSQFAQLIDPKIVTTLSSEPYDTPQTVLFQRTTVILSDILLLIGCVKAASSFAQTPLQRLVCTGLILLSPVLFMIDHIHFQYNGFLLGILLLSLGCLGDNQPVIGGALYAALLMLKHLYLPLAPLYFLYLLRNYVLADTWGNGAASKATRLVLLGGAVLAVFAAALGPVLLAGGSPLAAAAQLAARLFPFQRGLVHAYWAPNAWALYLGADRLALAALRAARRAPDNRR